MKLHRLLFLKKIHGIMKIFKSGKIWWIMFHWEPFIILLNDSRFWKSCASFFEKNCGSWSCLLASLWPNFYASWWMKTRTWVIVQRLKLPVVGISCGNGKSLAFHLVWIERVFSALRLRRASCRGLLATGCGAQAAKRTRRTHNRVVSSSRRNHSDSSSLQLCLHLTCHSLTS